MASSETRPQVSDRSLLRCPPHDEDAERGVIGALLQPNSAPPPECLSTESFYLLRHQQIYTGILELWNSSNPVDCVTIKDWLSRQQFDVKILPGDLIELMESVPSSAHLESHALIVQRKKLLREVILGAGEILSDAYSDERDPLELLDGVGQIAVRLARQNGVQSITAVGALLQDVFDNLESVRAGEVVGLRTGFHELDQLTGGLRSSQFVIVAGRPSMGKTSWCLNVARNVSEQVPVAIFSMEVDRIQLATNMLCAEARVNQLRVGRFTEDELRRLHAATGRLIDIRVHVDDDADMTIGKLRAKARAVKLEHDIGLVIVDYLQLLDGDRKYENREKEVSAISKGLKALARELDVPVIGVSQLNREPDNREDHRPRSSDLRESGSLEQDADLVIMTYRPKYYDLNYENDHDAELIVVKQRNGPTGTVRVVFMPDYTRFENRSPEDLYVPPKDRKSRRAKPGASQD